MSVGHVPHVVADLEPGVGGVEVVNVSTVQVRVTDTAASYGGRLETVLGRIKTSADVAGAGQVDWVIEAAYESHEELGEASLMITKHCVRFSLSLCPKQAKGVTGVQGTIRAEPLTIQHGKDTLTLRFDCKPCEMHVVGRIRSAVLQAPRLPEHGVPVQFYKHRPTAVGKASAQPQPTDA